MNKAGANQFFEFARARHRVYLARMSGQPAPWTDDPVLRKNRFTNVFRELDRTTVWFRENMRNHLRKSNWVVPVTVLFRWFNKIEMGEIMLQADLIDEVEWNIEQFEQLARLKYPNGPWVTGSYMVFSGKKNGDKLTGLLKFFKKFMLWWNDKGEDFFKTRPSMEKAHEALMECEGLSGFTAYEIVTDLRWTNVVSDGDRNRWCHSGPGATRGMSRLLYRNPEKLDQFNVAHQYKIRQEMINLLLLSRNGEYWPDFNEADWPKWELRDIEHTLCEFDKYERVRRGEGQTKRLFKEELALPLPNQGA